VVVESYERLKRTKVDGYTSKARLEKLIAWHTFEKNFCISICVCVDSKVCRCGFICDNLQFLKRDIHI
jgi:hypothetical protein